MPLTTVGIVFKVVNEGAANLASIERQVSSVDRRLSTLGTLGARLGGLAAVGTAVYAVSRAVQSSVTAYAQQEQAEQHLAAALGLTNESRAETVSWLSREATALARVTSYTSQQILDEMALAHSMGLSTGQLVEGTRAAIGLAAAYGKDLHEGIRIVALAS